ncbi:hypothetical protein [Streptomyces lushanensis]|uniref:hypothetical protein n=1 Tax=Streptomyces lushanensis TaxID=1434255 RepID=UPI00083360BD|nr:hypothetical protein [Streptomyces lushanensis]
MDAVDTSGNSVRTLAGDPTGRRTPPSPSTTCGPSYTGTTAAAGTTHVHRVTALHADGTESAPGDAWAAPAPRQSG